MPLTIRVEAHAIAVVIRLALRLLPLPRVVTLLERPVRARRSVSTTVCAAAAAEAARHAAHPTCLFTALTAFALLRRHGHAPRFVIGAARGPAFHAHAWITVGGVPLVPSVGYVPLWSCGTASAEAS